MQRVFLILLLLIIVIYTTSCGELNTMYFPGTPLPQPSESLSQACKDKSFSLINNEQNLKAMKADGNYCLTKDLKITTWQTIRQTKELWTFKGTFNGNNKEITIDTIEGNSFIQQIGAGGTFKNVTIDIKRIEPGKEAKIAVLTITNSGTIKNVTIKGNNESIGPPIRDASIGGLVAKNYGRIEDVIINDITIKSSEKYSAGGLAGYNKGTITNAKLNNVQVEGNKNAPDLYLGGLVGNNVGTITNAKLNNIKVAGNENASNLYLGGLVGLNDRVEDETTKIINTGQIEGVELTGVKVSGSGMVGGLAGYSKGTIKDVTLKGVTLNNVKVESNKNAPDLYLGGLAGYNEGTITNANVSAPTITVTEKGNIGGLVGKNAGTIEGSHASVNTTITATGQGNIGGLVGYNKGTIEGSHASVNTTINYDGDAVINAGGFIGLQDLGATTSNSYSAGSLTHKQANKANLGGFIGKLTGSLSSESKIEKSYTMTDIQFAVRKNTKIINIGGFIGLQAGGKINNCYSAGTLTNGAYNNPGGRNTTYLGGFIGQLANGEIESVYTRSKISYNENGVYSSGDFAGSVNKRDNIKTSYYMNTRVQANPVGSPNRGWKRTQLSPVGVDNDKPQQLKWVYLDNKIWYRKQGEWPKLKDNLEK